MTDYPLRDLPDSERPRERLLNHGAGSLSNAELVAILLRTGTQKENVLRLAERILIQCGGIKGLAQASPDELRRIDGLGDAKITQILSALELGKRLLTYQPDERPMVHNATDAAGLVLDMGGLQQEHIRIILLDSARRVIAIPTIYIGTVNAAMLRTSEVFRDAIIRNAPAVILVHNHPSGDPSPSPEDIELTRTLREAGQLLDILLVDHIIIGGQDWRSMKELNLGFY